MSESHIDKRTPEEMYQQAQTRIISIADAILKANGWKHNYIPLVKTYKFDFDKNSTYHYHGKSIDGFFFHFRRNGDFATLAMTKYSTPPSTLP